MSIILEPRWPREEAQQDISRVWESVEKEVNRLIIAKLYKEKFTVDEDDVSFFPDWTDMYAWKVKTIFKRIYTCFGWTDEEEKIVFMEGRLFVSYGAVIPYDGSFKFALEKDKNLFKVDIKTIKHLIEEHSNMDEDSATIRLAEDIFNDDVSPKGPPSMEAQLEKDLRHAWGSIGTRDNEINLMIHNVVTHDKFTDALKFDDLFRMGLDSQK